MAFTRIWRFRPAPGAERAFEATYGPHGPWAILFRSGAGYLGTELQQVSDGSGDYLTIDRWESREHWDAFRAERGAAYATLDRECESLTIAEELVQEITDGEAADAGRGQGRGARRR